MFVTTAAMIGCVATSGIQTILNVGPSGDGNVRHDVDRDTDVAVRDLVTLLTHWGSCS